MLDFAIQALGIFGEIVLQSAFFAQRFQARPALLEALPGYVLEIAVGGMFGGNIELRKWLLNFLQAHLAALGDVPGTIQRGFRLWHFAKHGEHFVARLEIKLGLGEAHAIRIAHGLAGLDTQQNFVRPRIALAHVVRIVGGNERNARLLRQPQQFRNHDLVLIQAVILNLEKEVLLSEHVGVAVGQTLGFLIAIGHDGLVDVAAQAGRHRDQALGVPGQQILVDPGFVVKAFEKRGGHQLQQIAIAILVLAQQHQVVVAIGFTAAGQTLLRDIHLASDHGMNAFLFGLVVELHRAKKIAVVRHRDGRHLLLHHQIHQLTDFTSAVEQRIVSVTM